MKAKHTIKVNGQPYVAATSSRLDDRTRTLKHGDSFAVFDRFGDIQSIGQGEQGIYHEDTRFLSRLELRLQDGRRPVLLNSTIMEDNSVLTVDLTLPDIEHESRPTIVQDTIHIQRAKLLWQDVCHEHLRFVNYGLTPVVFDLLFDFEADFADIFEVRGAKRVGRGTYLQPLISEGKVILGYQGLDNVIRQTQLIFEHEEGIKLTAKEIHFTISLAPQESKNCYLTISCKPASDTHDIPRYIDILEGVCCEVEAIRKSDCLASSSNEQFNDWINRSSADLHLLVSDTPYGPYPYAGVPWFNTPFGRDGIITALQYLWVNPTLARGVLAYLAATQAKKSDQESDADPGKILHETRKGEMAALGEVPFAQYYGSIDATPLFIILAGAYHARTGDHDFIKSIWPNIEAALKWIDKYGDKDGDGFVEYERQSPRGLVQQGWKDSNDSVFHADGELAQGSIALCEVQAYVYDAWLRAAQLYRMLGKSSKAQTYELKANKLKQHFNDTFWCEDLNTFALALDGDKQPCRVRSSNSGHLLYSGIVLAKHARSVTDTLLCENSFSGWGIRTIADGEINYNPMSYHNGAVWPHDNAIIALGLARYGFKDEANKVITGLFDTSLFMDLHRMPELFCGFAKRDGGGPTLYPVACAPQAWASTVVFASLQACLGLSIIGTPHCRISFHNPTLPSFMDRVQLRNLTVGGASVDLLIRRYEQDVGIIVLRREGEVEITVIK